MRLITTAASSSGIIYAQRPDGSLLFHPLPAPSDEDVARLARAVCRKVTRYLEQLTGEDKD